MDATLNTVEVKGDKKHRHQFWKPIDHQKKIQVSRCNKKYILDDIPESDQDFKEPLAKVASLTQSKPMDAKPKKK